jgi:hypothetical protein
MNVKKETKPKAITEDGFKVFCAFDSLTATDDLKPNPNNPNKHPKEQIKQLAKIIKFNGWRAPITVSKRSGFIVRGHGRLAAAKELGTTSVPVDFQEYDDDASEYADLIADNQIAELSATDDLMLDNLLSSDIFKDFDLDLAGIRANLLGESVLQVETQQTKPYDYLHALITVNMKDAEKLLEIIKYAKEKGADVTQNAN